MVEVMNRTKGGIALHVEPDNPAKFLYEKLGFTHKYLEMRLHQDQLIHGMTSSVVFINACALKVYLR